MKKSYKVSGSLFLMLLILMSLASTVFAASTSIIRFNGFSKGFDFQYGSKHTETGLFGNFKDVMPGDTVAETITFINSATDCDFVKLYMRAEVHDGEADSLSPRDVKTETAASTSEFLSKVSMKVWNGTERIYDASPDQLDGLKDNKFLGKFRTGETATLKVELSLPIELDNKFASRAVDWVFTVEAYKENESQGSVSRVWPDDNTNQSDNSITTNIRNLIQTGQLNWPIWVLGGAGLVLVILGGAILVKKKKKNNG